MARTPGIDVSRWQGAVDWPVVAAQGYRFAAFRATVGDYYTDPRFYENWRGATRANLFVSAYHVVKPSIDPNAQIERLFDVLDGRNSDLPLVLDVELADGQPPETVSAVVRDCADQIETRDGRRPIIYTAKWFWDPNVLRRQEWRDYDLWIASYGVESPTLPVDWSEWALWQYSETGSVSGVSSRATDLNWFNGSEDDLRLYCGLLGHTFAGRAAAGATGSPRLRLRVVVPTLRIHSGPGAGYEHVGELQAGDVIEALAIEGDEVWVCLAPGRWAALKYQGDVCLVFDDD